MSESEELQTISGRLERGEIDSGQFLEQFTRFVAARIGCSRAGVWIFIETSEGRALRCVALYDATLDRMVAATDMVNTDVGLYFESLLRDGNVIAPDARSHPATLGFMDEYLLPLDIHSLMDVCFSVNGTLFGAFSCEQVGAAMDWTPRQFQALRRIGARASLTLMHAITSTVDTAPGALWEPGSRRCRCR